jgi:hypothetical protein
MKKPGEVGRAFARNEGLLSVLGQQLAHGVQSKAFDMWLRNVDQLLLPRSGHVDQNRPSRDFRSRSIFDFFNSIDARRTFDGMSKSAKCCHVWTAPGWQGKSSRRRLGRCCHLFGL